MDKLVALFDGRRNLSFFRLLFVRLGRLPGFHGVLEVFPVLAERESYDEPGVVALVFVRRLDVVLEYGYDSSQSLLERGHQVDISYYLGQIVRRLTNIYE